MNRSSETAAAAATVAAAAGVVLPTVHNSTKLNESLCCLHITSKVIVSRVVTTIWQRKFASCS
jgi:hypothetical protein